MPREELVMVDMVVCVGWDECFWHGYPSNGLLFRISLCPKGSLMCAHLAAHETHVVVPSDISDANPSTWISDQLLYPDRGLNLILLRERCLSCPSFCALERQITRCSWSRSKEGTFQAWRANFQRRMSAKFHKRNTLINYKITVKVKGGFKLELQEHIAVRQVMKFGAVVEA